MSEHDEQALFVSIARARWPDVVIASVPNGMPLGGLSSKQKAKIINWMKAEGLLVGMPDLLIFAPRLAPPNKDGARILYCGLALEFKRVRGGTLSDAQKDILAKLEASGYYTAVPHGYEEAMEITETYMAWQPPPLSVRVIAPKHDI